MSDDIDTHHPDQTSLAMGVSLFSGLPVELFNQIASYLSIKDRKSIRLTCARFDNLSTIWVYRDVYIPHYHLGLDFQFRQFPKLVDKYGHLVRTIFVDSNAERDFHSSSCSFRPTSDIEELSEAFHTAVRRFHRPRFAVQNNLEFLSMYSVRVLREPCLIHRATLFQPRATRIFQNLQSVELNFDLMHQNGTAHLFLLVPSLEKLTINVWSIDDLIDFDSLAPFHRQTNLRSLTLNCVVPCLDSLRSFLSFPKALSRLDLGCCPRPRSFPAASFSAADLLDVLSVQRESLEVLRINWQRDYLLTKVPAYVEDPEPEPGDGFSLSAFPILREYVGFYPDSSGRFPDAHKPKGKRVI